MSKRTILVICSIILVLPLMVFAGPGHEHDQADVSNLKGKLTSFEGTLVCKSCSLKKEFGARSECKLNGCSSALKTSDGKFVDFLDNKYAQDLNGKKYSGKQIKVSGMYFANANIIDVESINVDGKSLKWCGGCKSMDGCSAK